ncbi:amidase family protein [Luteimonas sp. SMYT11W]|uniref:Amidase family protein n=1 Tax=Luteimonas flava TaxID=3115822 RepID=A0ABU7WGW9_9GAMM
MTVFDSPAGLADALALGRLDAHAQGALRARGELGALDLTDAAILRARHFDPVLGALSHTAFDAARQHARALDAAGVDTATPLAGVPWLPKDSLRVPGMPTRGGSRSRTGTLATADEASPFVRRFEAAGLVAIGKSAMPEFGLMGSTEPLLGPVTANPWALTHSPGGSSGGAGAALAAGIVPLAHGSDGAGSIRIPASACGVVGLKPGRGACVPVRGRHAIEDLIVADSLMSRTVRDTAWAFAAAHPESPVAVTGPDARRLRIGLVVDALPGLAPDPEVAAALDATARLCQSLGHHVEPVAWPLPGEAVWAALYTLWSRLGADAVELAVAQGGAAFAERALEPWTRGLAHWHDTHCGVPELEQAWATVAALPAAFADFHARHDVLLCPTLRTPPPTLGTLAPDRDFDALMPAMFEWISYTPLQNLAGTPAISLPLAHGRDGLPIGLQFAADRGREAMLLALAFELETAAPWCDRWPPVSVAATQDTR